MGRDLARWVWITIGITLLGLPLLPIAAWVDAPDGGPPWQDYLASWGIGLLLVSSVSAAVGWLGRKQEPASIKLDRLCTIRAALVISFVVILLSAATSHIAFARNPHLIDEMAQLFHAKILASGALAAPEPSIPEFFLLPNTFVAQGGWISQYPPGHSLLLAIGSLLNAEWLVNPVLGGASTLLLYIVARGLYGKKVATLSAILWALSAWVVFMSATYMNHVGALTFSLLAWALVMGPAKPKTMHFVLAGASLAAVAATRPLDAVAAAVPVFVFLVQRRSLYKTLPILIGAAPVLLLWAYVNGVTVGSPWASGYAAFYGPEQRLGFHMDPFGNDYTPVVGLANLSTALRRMHIYFYEWPIPALLPLALWALLARSHDKSDLIIAVGMVAVPVLYFFYWHSAFYPGPRFYYGAAPFVVIGTAKALLAFRHWARRSNSHHFHWELCAATAAVVVFVWSAGWLFPDRVRSYGESFPSLKVHPERALQERGVEQALVLIPESWGSRVIVRLSGAGVAYGAVERAYRSVDTCTLHELAERVTVDKLSASEVTSALRALTESVAEVPPKVVGAPDETIRLWPGRPVSEACLVEMNRDSAGFGLFGVVGWRNEIGLDKGIVYARDLFEQNEELLDLYPGWQVWRYAPPPEAPEAPPVLQLIQDTEA